MSGILTPNPGFGGRLAGALAAASIDGVCGLAQSSGVSRYSIESWLAERARPRADNLERVAAALGVSSAQLLTGDTTVLVSVPAPSKSASSPMSGELDSLLREIVSRLADHIVDILVPTITARLERQNVSAAAAPEVLNMKECAALIGRSRHTVREFTRRLADPIPHHRPGGAKGDAVYIRSEVLGWLSKH